MVVVADAGMLSENNLAAIDDAQLRFVGSRQTREPQDLATQSHDHRVEDIVDGATVDTVNTRGRFRPDPKRVESDVESVWDPETQQYQ